MSTIQQAAKRLEELRRAGVAIPWESDDAEAKARAEALAQSGDVPAEVTGSQALPLPVMPAMPAMPAVHANARQSELVNLDLVKLAEEGYLVPGHSSTQLGEEFRVIKRPLIRNAQGKGAAPVHHGNLIVVTSSMAGEGKTFFAMNLALSIAMELDASALLVEADILKPAVMHRLGLPQRRGLLDMLTDPKIDASEVMLRTNIPKLSLLPAGSRSMQSTELLASARMGEFLDELATRYRDRIIVFDAPPLLQTSEAQVLAARAGQVVVVVEAGRTSAAAFTQAMDTLESCPVVMTALNKSK
ncbi:MAG: XrtA-associated tyrosine autokinase, partial [Rhizobacter sp.]